MTTNKCEKEQNEIIDTFTKELYEAIAAVRQSAARQHKCVWNLAIELHKEVWEYVRLNWREEELQQWDSCPLYAAIFGPPPKRPVKTIQEYVRMNCKAIETILLELADEQEKAQGASGDNQIEQHQEKLEVTT